MRKLAALLIAAAALLALLGIVISAVTPRYPTAAELAAEQIQIERMHALDPLYTFVAGAWALVPLAVVVATAAIALGLASAWGVAALVRFRQLARPDGAGMLPVLLGQLPDVAPRALAAYHAGQLAAAQRANVPLNLTYSPHYRADSRGVLTDPAVEPLAALPSPLAVPSFAELLDQGAIGAGQPMLLGYDVQGVAIKGSWQQLYSCAVGGLSGSGKSTTVAFLAGQAVLQGAKIVLCDPHAGDKQSLTAKLEPLASRFLCAPASAQADMGRAVQLVADELRRRLAAPRGTVHAPWLFICDEFSAMQRGALAEPLAVLGEQLGQEGRKLGMYGMFAGQVWSASRSGGSELRDSLASAYIHRLRPAQARMLTGLTADDLPSDLMELPAGTAYLLDTGGQLTRVAIPLVTAESLAAAAGQPAAPPSAAASTGPAGRPFGFRPEGVTEGATEGARRAPLPAQQDAAQWTPEEAQIVAALASGKKPGELAEQLSGQKGGRSYQAAAEKIAAVIARLALRLHRPAA